MNRKKLDYKTPKTLFKEGLFYFSKESPVYYISMLFFLVCLFPYTQIVFVKSYTQPYALILGFSIFLIQGRQIISRLYPLDLLFLLGMFFIGICSYLVWLFPAPSITEIKYLTTYISPLLITIPTIFIVSNYLKEVKFLVSLAAIIWIIFGVIQIMYDPSFGTAGVGYWKNFSLDIFNSGRGVLSLAPEPTHFGFHLIVLAAILTVLQCSIFLILSCIASVFFLSRSSSAILCLFLGFSLFILIKRKIFPIALIMLVFFFQKYINLFDIISSKNIRVLTLVEGVFSHPESVLSVDRSVNARLGGVIASIVHSFNTFFIPHGLSHQNWLNDLPKILKDFPWLNDLSSYGCPSGIFIIIYQLGFIGILLLTIPIASFFLMQIEGYKKSVILSVIFIFMGQFMISTPCFSVLYGCIIWAPHANFFKR